MALYYFIVLVLVSRLVSCEITCVGEHNGTSCATASTCEEEHDNAGVIEDMCASGSSGLYQPSNELSNQLFACTSTGQCETAPQNGPSTRFEGKPEVFVDFETVNYKRFNLNITWEHNPVTSTPLLRKGYQVSVKTRESRFGDLDTLLCFCVEGRDTRHLEVADVGLLTFPGALQGAQRFQMVVEVAPYPLPFSVGMIELVTGKWGNCEPDSSPEDCQSYPQSCLDIGTSNCLPPRYPLPKDISFTRDVVTGSSNISGTLSFTPVSPHPGWNHSAILFTYYVTVEENTTDWFKVFLSRKNFKIQSQEQERISVKVLNLNASLSYVVSIQTFYPCTGLADSRDVAEVGCGPGKDIKHPLQDLTQPPPMEPTTLSPTSAASDQTPTTAASDHTPPAAAFDETTIVVVVVTVMLGLLFFAVILTFVFVVLARWRSNQKKCAFSNFVTDPFCRRQPHPHPHPVHFPVVLYKWKVFVAFSPLSDSDYILSHVVQCMRMYEEAGDMIFSCPLDDQRGCPVAFIEEQVRTSDAVFIVCDQAFNKDWQNQSSPEVNAIQNHIHAKVRVGKNQPEKFGVVVLDSREDFIPSDHLINLRRFNMGETVSPDDSQMMLHFVRNTKPFELEPRSPDSGITMSYSLSTSQEPVRADNTSRDTLDRTSDPSIPKEQPWS